MSHRIALAAFVLVLTGSPASGSEPILMKEGVGSSANIGTPCALPTSTDGTAANYRWYNLCSGYIWIYGAWSDIWVGTLFGGPEQLEVNDSNVVKRAITYFRNVIPGYIPALDIYVDRDLEGDGCPDIPWLSDLNTEAFLRWNCTEFNAQIPQGTNYLIVRAASDQYYPTFVTDGPYDTCNPNAPARSFWYEFGSNCPPNPIVGPDGTYDNLLFWLIIDAAKPAASEARSWGAIKGLFR